MLKLQFVVISFWLLTACSSSSTVTRTQPSWISQSTRTVDNGYIVYVGSGEEISGNDAELAAEGMAIQDLANECSFIPKGTRVEDRYSEKQNNTFKAYAKIAVEYQTCDEASKTTDPTKIKEMASAPFTEELRKFEDSIQGHRDEVVDAELNPEGQPAGTTTPQEPHISNDVHFFMARQYVVYQNSVVVLSPPGTYAPGSPETIAYTTRVRPVVGHLQTYLAQNPELRAHPQTWSAMAPQVRTARPQAFASPHLRNSQIRPPGRPGYVRPNRGGPANPNPGQRGRRRGRRNKTEG